MPKLLLVEDHVETARELERRLGEHGFDVEWSAHGQEACLLLVANVYDVIVLDWELPGVSGVDICRNFREHGGQTPVIMLTGRDTVPDKILGLRIGADEYVTKPYHPLELIARIKAVMRRGMDLSPNVLDGAGIEFDTVTALVTREGREVRLSPLEHALLEFFMRNPDQVFSPEDLLDAVWTAESERSAQTVRTCIKKLRSKLDLPGRSSPIENVFGVGYKFVR